MQIQPKITFQHMDPSPALENKIKEKIAKLEKRYPRMTKCQVIVDAAHHHKRKGNAYSVHVLLTFPGNEIIVSQHPGKNPLRHELPFAAMNDAFLAIEKQLLHQKDLQKADVKPHASVLLTGHVARLDVGLEHGFIAMEDGTEIYFHPNSVHSGRFFELKEGSKVRFSFIEGEGIEGPQANFVRLLRAKKD